MKNITFFHKLPAGLHIQLVKISEILLSQAFEGVFYKDAISI